MVPKVALQPINRVMITEDLARASRGSIKKIVSHLPTRSPKYRRAALMENVFYSLRHRRCFGCYASGPSSSRRSVSEYPRWSESAPASREASRPRH
ncbi:unnamed protein product [Danaus chrysippus]|uniref:(African queen) hypothetical protein n=1 Tax=Danaus chrysippus TaxID=151541 RepID=A0A8J2VUX4_9NEOP|nr:unnamed protein product [Danaus chrysippus]